MATNGNTAHPDHADTGNSPSKDEVGWYFVEQYYTTLSKAPEKLHLFYGKKSQFVYGQEAEVANVSVGRQAIQERVKELDFQDCKVRISNVDAQGSGETIVIQVIGETSNKSGEPRKFVQTFILAQQPSGYFVLNDILRFIKEEDDEQAVDSSAQPDVSIAEPTSVPAEIQPEQEAPKSVADAEEPTQAQLDPAVVDKKLEEAGAQESQAGSTVSSVAEPAPAQQAAPAASSTTESVPDPEKAAREIAEEEAKKAETPKDPTPTPVPARAPAPAVAEPEKPKEPAKPMTWASRIAAAAGPPKPVVPLPKAAAPTAAPAKSAAAPAAAAPAPATAQPAAAAPAQPAEPAAKDGGNEWQTAGADSKKQGRPQSISGPPQQEGCLGYVKYVTEKVGAADLKGALAKHGELVYFDINRMKNCAFVEFASPAGYQAAVAANPHTVNGESIVVEPRRPKAGAYGGSNYNQNRGSISGRGRGGFEGGRSGSQSGGRGGFGGQTRGRGGSSGAPRGRGPSQTANA